MKNTFREIADGILKLHHEMDQAPYSFRAITCAYFSMAAVPVLVIGKRLGLGE